MPYLPVVISFYTRNTPYEQEVTALFDSCETHRIESRIVGKASRGSWEKNCAMKPFFILHMLEELRRPVFWIDADAVFLKKPDFSAFEKCDLAVRTMTIFRNDPRFYVNTASLLVNYTPEARALLEKWCVYCQEDHQISDQPSLYRALQENTEAKIHDLPVSYCKVFDLDQFFIDDQDVVIEQRQASRHFKRSV